MNQTFTLKKALLSIVLVLFWLSSTYAQDQIYSGRVVDAADQTGLPGVTILVKGTSTATQTNTDGNFSIGAAKGSVLVIRYIGYESTEITVGASSTLSIALSSDLKMLDEIVVTGYGGTQKRSKLTNSIATVKAETFEKGVYSNPAQALSGAVSGLKVVQSSGKPGAVPSIVLRGGTNLDGSGSPLVLVDGQVRGINDLNPEDIASMEVLKDAGATALYGARANNGVILITTKRGKAGFSDLTLKTRMGLSYINNPFKFMGAADYLKWARTGVYNSGRLYQNDKGEWTGHGKDVQGNLNGAQPFGLGNQYFDAKGVAIDGNKSSLGIWSPMRLTDNLRFLLNEGWQSMIDPVTGEEIIFSEFDRSSTAFNQPALTQDYNLGMSGGSEKGSYYASIGYQDAKGNPASTWYKRLTVLFNGDYQVKDWLKSSTSFNLNNAKWYDVNNTSEGNYFGRMLSAPPTQREYNANGELLLGTNSGDGNPLYNIDKFKRDNQTDKFTMIQSFKVDIMKDLSFNTSATWMYDEGFYESFNRDYLSSPGNINKARNSSASFGRTLRQTYNAVLNYNTVLAENHNLSALAGTEFYDAYNKGFAASGSGAPTDDFGELSQTSKDEGKRNISSNHSRERILSFFGRVNYDYKSKYILSLTARQDGYSKLIDNRWGLFPGASAGWVLSQEEFMSKYSNVFSFLKLRASYGLNGNVSNIGNYELQGSYTSGLYNNQIGYTIGNIPNPGLKWERSQTFEVGVDMGFLKNTINANLTYYNRLTLDKYATIPLPVTSGITGIRSNNGEYRNKGIEVDLGFNVLRNENVRWNINTNIAYNKNIIEKLPENGLERNRQGAYQVYDSNTGNLKWVGGYQEGQSPGGIWAFVADGIFKNEAEVLAKAGNRKDITSGNNGSNGRTLYGPSLWSAMTDAQRGNGLPIQPGDINWKDVNGDGVIDNFDMVYVGNTSPKWFGGFSSDVTWKNLTLSARLDYALGFKQVDVIRPWFMGMMQGSFNTLNETADSWTPENVNAKYPTYTWADQLGKRNYARNSDMFIKDASYLSFREISLSYSLPLDKIKVKGISAVDVSVTGQNLGYISKSELFSPEAEGSIGGGYPLPRTIIFGLNLKF